MRKERYNRCMKIVMTGGHHSSALPVIEELKKRLSNPEFLWVGHKFSLKEDKNESLEYKEIVALNIPFYELKTAKFYKNLKLSSVKTFFEAFGDIYKVLRAYKPDLIMSYGGYLAVPVVLAGWFQRVPIITHEQTVTVGYANRVISFFASKILVSWEESLKFLPKNKTVITGIPLRNSIFGSQSQRFNIVNELPTIYVTGGKSGAHKINMLIKDSLAELLTFCNVIHQCGDYSVYNDYALLTDYHQVLLSSDLPGEYFLEKFVFDNNIGEVFSKAKLVVSRAGAHIVSELFALNKPCILIPIPWVSHDEQRKNAEMLKKLGIALDLDETNLNAEEFILFVKRILADPSKYSVKFDTKKKFIYSAGLIADEIIKQTKGN